MISTIKNIFTTAPKAVDTAADLAKDISSGVDVLFETDEEKTQYQMRAFDQWLTMVDKLKDSQTMRAITRRILAVLIVISYLSFLWVGLYAFLVDYYIFDLRARDFVGAPAYCLGLADKLEWGFVTVLVFYFGPYMMRYMQGFFGRKAG